MRIIIGLYLFLSGIVFAADPILIVDVKGRSFKAVPVSVGEKEITVLKMPNKKKYVIPISNLSEETIERAREYLLQAKKQKQLDKANKLNEGRKKLHAYTKLCRDERVTFYTTLKNCVVENVNRNDVYLLAPDKSEFYVSIYDKEIKDAKAAREVANAWLEKQLHGKTAPERKAILRKVKIVDAEISGHKGYEVKPLKPIFKSTIVRLCFLSVGGKYYMFYNRQYKSAKIDNNEWERILKYIKFE